MSTYNLNDFTPNQLVTFSSLLAEVVKETDSTIEHYGYNDLSGYVWIRIDDYDLVICAFEGRTVDAATVLAYNEDDEETEYDSLREAINAI